RNGPRPERAGLAFDLRDPDPRSFGPGDRGYPSPAMTLLLLVRHAVTDVTGKRLSGSIPGIHLAEEGRVQAKGLAERLAPLRLTAVYASPLQRCVETEEQVPGATRQES